MFYSRVCGFLFLHSKSNRRYEMSRFITFTSFLLLLILIPFSSNAQQLYISTELGLGIGNSLDTDASDNDFGTLCDQHLNPEGDSHFDPGVCSYETSVWNNSFDGSTGVIAGVALGVSTDLGARIEAEYFYFGSQYDTTSSVVGGGQDIADKADQELVRSDERIGAVNINSLFVNVYYDLPVSGQLRPYVGGGVGFGMAELEFDAVWARNINPDVITTADDAEYLGSGNEEQDRQALHQRIAGVTSTASHTLEDTVFGYQAIVGVDYMLTESASIGVKGRWVKYAKFSGGDVWDQLRGHEPNNGPGTNTVEYTIETEDLSAFGVSLVMKYAF